MGKQYQEERWLREKYHEEGLSGREVAEEAGVSWPTISRWMDHHDISRRDRIQSNSIDLSSEALDFVEGHVLGDACLTNYHKGAALFAISNKYREVVEWYVSRLKSYGIEFGSEGIVDTEGGFGHQVFTVRTRSYPSFGDLREKWYPNGDLQIPRSLKLSPISLKQWYIGDGSLSGNSVTITADRYERESVECLCSQIKAMGVDCYINAHNGDANRVYIPADSAADFFGVIGSRPDPIPCYDYKWP